MKPVMRMEIRKTESNPFVNQMAKNLKVIQGHVTGSRHTCMIPHILNEGVAKHTGSVHTSLRGTLSSFHGVPRLYSQIVILGIPVIYQWHC